MTEKEKGTADVTLVLWVENKETAAHLMNRFAVRARAQGTLVVVETATQEVANGAGLYVWLRYRHTAKNKGNHDWDAQRFLARVFDGGPLRSHLYRVELNAWEPV